MKIAILLLTWVIAGVFTQDCAEVGEFPTSTYKPPLYEPTWEITNAASYSDPPVNEFIARLPTLMENTSLVLEDVYVYALVYAAGVTVAMLLFFNWFCTPCFCCCRLNHCCMCCPCKQPCLKCRLPCKSKAAGRIAIIVAFVFFFMSAFFMYAGRNLVGEFITSVDKSISVLEKNVDSILIPLESAVNQSRGISAGLKSIGKGSCTYEYSAVGGALPSLDNVNDPVKEAASNAAIFFDDIIDASEGGVKGLRNSSNALETRLRTLEETFVKSIYEPYLDPGIVGMTIAFVTIAVLGILGSFKFTRCVFWFIANLAFIIITILSILMAVEFIFGVLAADLCTPAPLTNIAELMTSFFKENMESTNTTSARRLVEKWEIMDEFQRNIIVQTKNFNRPWLNMEAPNGQGQSAHGQQRQLLADQDFTAISFDKIISYYLTCGDNPFGDAGGGIRKSMVSANNATCTMNKELKAAGTKVNAELANSGITGVTAEQVNEEKCNGDINKVNNAMTDTTTSVLEGIGNLMGCKLVNEPLVLFIEQGFCSQLATGVFSIYCAQLSACIFLLFSIWTMIIAMDNLSDEDEKDAHGIQMA